MTIVQASFFWKNDKPGGLGFTFGPPDFTPEILTDMFSGEALKQYIRDSDLALGTGVVDEYFHQLAHVAQKRRQGQPVDVRQAMLVALNIIWLTERGFMPNDEFNGPQFIRQVK